MAQLRSLRGPLGAALVAVSHSDECLSGHVERQRSSRPPHGPGARRHRRLLSRCSPAGKCLDSADPGRQCRCLGRRPGRVAEQRESVRLAFVAALQHLPARQRAVLILREVLRWKAAEVAELLETSVASVNSSLQRHRAALAAGGAGAGQPSQPVDEAQQALLARYVDAFERYDMESLTSLLYEDATWSMPPYELWLRGHLDIQRWCLGPGIGCDGSRLVPTMANGAPAFGQYKPGEDGYEPWSLQVLDVSGDRISGIVFFLDTATLFPLFGLPPRLER